MEHDNRRKQEVFPVFKAGCGYEGVWGQVAVALIGIGVLGADRSG